MLHCIPGPFNEKDKTELYNQLAKEIKNQSKIEIQIEH